VLLGDSSFDNPDYPSPGWQVYDLRPCDAYGCLWAVGGRVGMSLDVWMTYFAACWIISLSPGAGAIASMSSGLRFGFWPGYWNVIGLQLALAVQILIVAAGVGAVLTTSELMFNLIKWFGVLYLVYLAWKQWSALPADFDSSVDADRQAAGKSGSPLRLVGKGFLVNSSNPKAIVFMLAVLPQFIDPARPLVVQYGVLMVTMIGVDMVVMAGYTSLASKVLRYLKSPRQQMLLNRSFAAMFVGAASLLSLVNRNR
jgi:homoserine/homoserine lactone efflux protein